MTTELKNVVDSIVVRLKAKDIYGPITQGQENVQPFLPNADCLPHFKRRQDGENVKLADEDAAEEFKSYLQSGIWEKSYVEEQVFNTDETLANEPI